MEFKENTIIQNKYKLIKEIAKGGMDSVIWKAEFLNINSSYDAAFKKYCAIKIINLNEDASDEQMTSISKEINTSVRAHYKSPIFCDIYDWFTLEQDKSGKKFAIVMELIEGMPLDRYLKQKGMLPVVEAMEYFENILLGIKSLHNMNSQKNEIIVHRDLKLNNVMITSDYSRVKIIDLGIASVLEQTLESKKRSLKINEHSIYGSLPYVPPDVKLLNSKMSNEEKAQIITEYWDIFACGVILYALITGEFPYSFQDKDSEKNYMRPELYDFATISSYVPEVSNQIENIVYKCLVSSLQEKHLRYKNVDEILIDIQNWKNNKNVSVPLLKPTEKRKLERIENFLVKRSGYEISSLFWARTGWLIWFAIAIIVFAALLLMFLL